MSNVLIKQARQVVDNSHIGLSYVTHFYLDQKKPDSVLDLLERYAQYAPEVLDRVQFVVVDDCSPLQFPLPELDLNLTWLRIVDDIPWNQGGARNLGMVYAASDKVLLTDIDHEFPEATLSYMLRQPQCGRDFFKIYRTCPTTGRLHKGHSNIFLLSRARFLRLYGYDEEFCGHYGAEDYRFVKFQKYHGSRQRYLPKRITCIPRIDIDRGAAYHGLERDLSHNTPIDARKEQEMKQYGGDAGHSRMFLRFRWEVALERSRNVRIQRKRNPLWQKSWYWRWLVGER
ncbi:hypothetical protein [Desulfonatronum thiodismutans]|uniref:hypothetical protein n=1 Tax=Desulfonatronum thiodismutans TaxID=159290 RepID=UPI0004ABE0CA|nr:hypothetical protein [Desulfonatronum thiodismutans]